MVPLEPGARGGILSSIAQENTGTMSPPLPCCQHMSKEKIVEYSPETQKNGTEQAESDMPPPAQKATNMCCNVPSKWTRCGRAQHCEVAVD